MNAASVRAAIEQAIEAMQARKRRCVQRVGGAGAALALGAASLGGCGPTVPDPASDPSVQETPDEPAPPEPALEEPTPAEPTPEESREERPWEEEQGDLYGVVIE